MALVAAPLSAAADEPWLGALAGCGLSWELLASPDGSAAAFDRGLEELLRAFDLPRTWWVARLSGSAADVAYAVEVVGGASDGRAVVRGRGAAWASAMAVDACGGGSRHRLVLSQVDESAVDDSPGAARVVVLREAGRPWALVAADAGALPVLRRLAASAPVVRLDAVLGARVSPRVGIHHGAGVLRDAVGRVAGALPVPAGPVGLRRRVTSRLASATAVLLAVAVVAAGAGWAVTHRVAAPGPAPSAPAVVAAPTPRVGTMAATWDRTAQVVLFGGATAGSGHGQPLDDTWRGRLPPSSPWQRSAPEPAQPVARLGGAMAADVADGYVLLYGGEASGDAGLGDTWTYAGGWAASQPRDSPPAGPALAATEPSTGRVLLVTTCCALGAVPTGERMQTWRWTGSDWSLLGAAPGWVTTASLASDPWDDTVVMVADGGSGRAATFVWDGGSWSALPDGSTEPPVVPGSHPALAYDPRTHAVLDVVTDFTGAHRTWSYTSAHGWSEQPGSSGPAVVGLVLRDPVDGHAMLYGGGDSESSFTERWFWYGGAWTESLQPPPVASVPTAAFGAAVAADPAGGGLVLFGGSESTEPTWEWLGTTWWDAFFAAPIPAPRSGASMAYDPATRIAYLVGGQLSDGSLARDMWMWRGGSWTRLDVPVLPPATVGAPMAWDQAHGQAVLLVLPADAASAALPEAQTWTWDAASGWTLRHPSVSPPLRAESSMSFDPATGSLMLAVPCCPGGVSQRTETWTWDGVTWTRRVTLHQPPIHAFIAADPSSRRTLLVAACCSGFDPASSIGAPQTWAWDGRDWTRLSASLPALQDVAALVTDARGVPTLVGRVAGAGPRHPLDGLWTWTGAAWLRLE